MLVGGLISDIHLDKLTKYWPDANSRQLDCIEKVAKQYMQQNVDALFF